MPRYAPGIPKLIFNQNGSYSFGFKKGDGFPGPDEVLKLYLHPDIKHVLCISSHDEMLLKNAFLLGDRRVSRLINGIETKLFRPSGYKKRIIPHATKNSRTTIVVIFETTRMVLKSWAPQPPVDYPRSKFRNIAEKFDFLAFGHRKDLASLS